MMPVTVELIVAIKAQRFYIRDDRDQNIDSFSANFFMAAFREKKIFECVQKIFLFSANFFSKHHF